MQGGKRRRLLCNCPLEQTLVVAFPLHILVMLRFFPQRKVCTGLLPNAILQCSRDHQPLSKEPLLWLSNSSFYLPTRFSSFLARWCLRHTSLEYSPPSMQEEVHSCCQALKGPRWPFRHDLLLLERWVAFLLRQKQHTDVQKDITTGCCKSFHSPVRLRHFDVPVRLCFQICDIHQALFFSREEWRPATKLDIWQRPYIPRFSPDSSICLPFRKEWPRFHRRLPLVVWVSWIPSSLQPV